MSAAIELEGTFTFLKQEIVHKLEFSEHIKSEPLEDPVKTEIEQVSTVTLKSEFQEDSLTEFVCEKCDYVTTFPSDLQNHMVLNHEGTPWFCCDKCEFKTNSEHVFGKHQLKYHRKFRRGKSERCGIVPFSSVSDYGFKRYLNQHHLAVMKKRYQYYCEDCQYKTTDWRTLRRHNMRRHLISNIEWFQCKICPCESMSEEKIKNHMQRRHGGKDYVKVLNTSVLICNYCVSTFKTAMGWIQHVLNQHSNSTFNQWLCCVFCKFKAKQGKCLKRHVFGTHFKKIGRDGFYLHHSNSLACAKCLFKTHMMGRMKAHILRWHSQSYTGDCCEVHTLTPLDNDVKTDKKHSVDTTFEYETRFYKRKDDVLKEHNANGTTESDGYSCSHCPFKAKKGFELKLHVSLMHLKQV